MDDDRNAGSPTKTEHTPHQAAIRAERALLALIVISLGATLNLLIAVHRHAQSPSTETTKTAAPLPQTAPTRDLAAEPAGAAPTTPGPVADSAAPPASSVPPEDPTKMIVTRLSNALAIESRAAQDADQRTIALEKAEKASVAESQRWKRRELLVRQQIAGLAARAQSIENAVSELDSERDVLAHERDALKAALAKDGKRSGFSVLPYKGPTGTWRRPIVLECAAGSVTLRPKGRTFLPLELSSLINPRSSPLVRAIAAEMIHIQAADTPDGAAAVPYLVFLVRPNGIRPYYQARTCLEPLGIAFGYELIEQGLAVDVPDFDNLATWDGTVPLDVPLESAPRPKATIAMNASDGAGGGMGRQSEGWPNDSSSRNRRSDQGGGNPDQTTPGDFVWPSRGKQNADGVTVNAGPDGEPAVGRGKIRNDNDWPQLRSNDQTDGTSGQGHSPRPESQGARLMAPPPRRLP